MKVLFDTSVLVATVVDQLPQHDRALECFIKYSGGARDACCSTHALAECYATLTALPLPRRIQPMEAKQLIEENFVNRLTVLDLPSSAYLDVLSRVSDLGLRSGVVYDALHLICAENAACKQLYTFNLRDFSRLSPQKIKILSP